MLEIVSGYDRLDDVRSLFREYTAMLVDIDPSFQIYLDLQHYEEEEEDPTVKYALPDGRLYLALWDGKVAGCIALRKLSDGKAELKRLYVRPAFRGHHIANELSKRIISEAKEIGYKEIYLDTLPELQGAVQLYRKLGFIDTECYNDSPIDKTLFMKKTLC